jgi:hypothetical protein
MRSSSGCTTSAFTTSLSTIQSTPTKSAGPEAVRLLRFGHTLSDGPRIGADVGASDPKMGSPADGQSDKLQVTGYGPPCSHPAPRL